MRRPSLRFSLRLLLLAAALVPVGIYWLALPTLNAQRFVEAVNARNFPAAERLCADRKEKFPGSWTTHAHFQPRANLAPLSWADFRSGQRQVYIAISYGDGSGVASCGQECIATRRGIELGMLAP
jgi:hypothetical protein